VAKNATELRHRRNERSNERRGLACQRRLTLGLFLAWAEVRRDESAATDAGRGNKKARRRELFVRRRCGADDVSGKKERFRKTSRGELRRLKNE